MTVLKAENLAVGYDGKTVAENLNFTLDEGDYLCILGENGSGKTTLMKTILGLNSKISGNLQVNGIKANQIGYLPQQTELQRDFPASVFEIVLSGNLSRIKYKPFFGRAEKELTMHTLKKMGIADISDKCYRELSGGQQQRVLLARALVGADKLLVLDEPVNGLDPNAAAELYETVYSLNNSGKTVIMVSHDIEAAKKYATHILHIGDDIFFGTKSSYFSEKGEL